MRSSLLVCALGLLAACDKGDDSSSSGTDDSQGDDSGGSKVDADKDGYDRTEDCDDTDAAVNPGATEVCDEIDNNCVDGVDEGVTTPFYADTDADTYGAGTAVDACTAPKGHVDNADDCDDTDATVNPAGTEVCDEIDNNCIDGVDEGVTTPFYADGDADGYGAGTALDACAAPTGYVDSVDDCDDLDKAVNPGAAEVCDKSDNDCDTDIDDDDADVTGRSTWYRDYDGDGYGDPSYSTRTCVMPSGYVDNDDDCLDSSGDYTIYADTYYDEDLDGYGSGSSFSTCYSGPGYVTVSGDCDDADVSINPGATEVCDAEDNDCDTFVDDEDSSVVYDGDDVAYTDADSDGYGDDSTAFDHCVAETGYSMTGGDCDDGDYLVSPGRDEYCDGIDNNCVDGADEGTDYVDWYRDDDGDHYGQDGDVINDCSQPAGYVLDGGDCDDTTAATNPDAEDVCGDDVDGNCDGYVDNCIFDIDDAGFSVSGETSNNDVGYSVGSGDINGDGIDDLLMGAPDANSDQGAVYVVYGPASGAITVSGVDATIEGTSGDSIGTEVTARDVDGDGYHDLLAAGADSNQVFLFKGPISSATAVSDADVSFTPSVYAWSFGYAIAQADLDGDADLDTAIGQLQEEYYSWDDESGWVWIVHGPLSGTVTSADLVVTGTSGGVAGVVANLGDQDGDGLDDLAQGAWYGGASAQGEVYVLDTTKSTGTVSASDIAVATMTGEARYDYFGDKMAGGDYNDDGYADLFASAMYADDGITNDTGRVYGWLGPLSGTFSASAADITVSGNVEYSRIGTDVAVGDVSGDGAADVVIGAPYADTYGGEACVLNGSTTGFIDLGSLATVGEADGATYYDGSVGYSVDTMGDWYGDGVDEIVIGGPRMPYDAKTSYAGKTWVVSSDNL